MNSYNPLTDFCERCASFTYVYRRNRQNYCKECLPFVGLPVPAPVEIPEVSSPKPAPRTASKPARFAKRVRLPHKRPRPAVGAAIVLKKRVKRPPVLEAVPGSLTAVLLDILANAPETGIRFTDIRDLAVYHGFAAKSVRGYLDIMAARKQVYRRSVYSRGHMAFSLYSLKPFPKLIQDDPVASFLRAIVEEPKSVPYLSALLGCSRTNVKHLFDRAKKKGVYIQATMKKNTRYYYLPPKQAAKLGHLLG